MKLRTKKLADGNLSLYLDCYRNGVRTYEFLKLYLIPETDAKSREQNKATMAAVNAIKSARIIEISNGEAGLTTKAGKLLLVDWLKEYARRKGEKSQVTRNKVECVIRYVKETKGGSTVMMKDVDRAFCLAVIDTLRNAKSFSGGNRDHFKDPNHRGERPLGANTQHVYYLAFTGALNEAVREGIIKTNPMHKVSADDKPKWLGGKREFLEVEEIKALMATPCQYPAIKRAFLFSCFTGLRISDIRKFTWSDLRENDGQTSLYFEVTKTKERLFLPVSQEAKKWMGEKGEAAPEAAIFELPHSTTLGRVIDRWAKEAGITKHVTFHCARHTFATLELTMGADLYTVSKLLGHTSVSTTQIYAKIVDQKKKEAVNLLNDLFTNNNESTTNKSKEDEP